MALGRPASRSVDSECVGRGNQPREIEIGEPTSWHQRKATSSAPYRPGVGGPPGCKSPGHAHKGVRPGTWENPTISAVQFRVGSGRPKVQAHSHRASATCGSKSAGDTAVPPSEGNEARRDGSGRLSTPIVPRKRGNHPEGPRGGKRGVGSRNRWRERWQGRRTLRASQRDFNG